MPDHFGLLKLPVATAPHGAAGDPALDVLGAFLSAVLTAELTKAWAPLAPGRPVVRRVFPFSVTKRRFLKEDMPSLFVFRQGNGKSEAYTADAYRRTQTVLVQWVYPPALNEHQIDRDPFVNAVGAAMERALYRGRHPAWVVPSDLAAPSGLLLPVATSTQPVTMTGGGLPGGGLTGPLASLRLQAARSVTITTGPAPGAYTVGVPIPVIGLDTRGVVLRDAVTLTGKDGGETVPTLWRFSAISALTFPAMASAAGLLSAGYAASPEVLLGSLLERHAGFFRLEVARPAEVKPLLVPIKNPETRGADAPMPFEMVEIALSVEELLDEDPAVHYAPLAAADGGDGAELDVLASDETVLEVADLE
jgi:hypothetical protein